MGKRRTSLAWISDRQRKHVTFSKRRKGLFKNAQEPCCLTGVTVGIICFSEVGNPFKFGCSADGKDGDDGLGRLLSIMQQHYSHSLTRLPMVVEEFKSISEENSSSGLPHPAAGNDSLLEPLHGGGVRASSDCVIEDEPEVGLLGQMQSMDEAETQKSPLCLIHALHMTQQTDLWLIFYHTT
ncbi:Agamous-like MADS-box protein [Nymphaea thermarum]|nr:Agamous-like MADS-box protein [Nymphaea thermarum]